MKGSQLNLGSERMTYLSNDRADVRFQEGRTEEMEEGGPPRGDLIVGNGVQKGQTEQERTGLRGPRQGDLAHWDDENPPRDQ